MLPAGGGSRRNSANERAMGSSSSVMLDDGRIAEGPVGAGPCIPKADVGLPNTEGGLAGLSAGGGGANDGAGEADRFTSGAAIPGMATPPNGERVWDEPLEAKDPFVKLPTFGGGRGCKSSAAW